jgi:hypothetical protein
MAEVEIIGPSSTVKRSGVRERLCARASAVLRTRWTELKLGSFCSGYRTSRFPGYYGVHNGSRKSTRRDTHLVLTRRDA